MEYFIETNNNTSFPRFMITREDQQYWNGDSWGDKQYALLYADPDEAIKDQQRFLVADMGEANNKTRFIVPFVVDVASNGDISIEGVRDWIKRAIGFYADTKTHGRGPDNSLVIGHLDIGSIQEVVI